MANCCKAPISTGFAVLVAVSGLLLALNGLALGGVGAAWDSLLHGAENLYTINGMDQSVYYTYSEADNPTLIYQGFLILLPVIPGFLQLCRKVRSMTILYLLSLLVAFSGSVAAAILGGIAWKDVGMIYSSYSHHHCKVINLLCSCSLPSSQLVDKTAVVQVADCGDIAKLRNLINAYFALSIVATLLTVACVYIGFMVSCNPTGKKPAPLIQQRTSEPPEYGSIYSNPNIPNTSTQVEGAIGSSKPLLSVPGSNIPNTSKGSLA